MKYALCAKSFGYFMGFAGFTAERFCHAQKNSADKSIFPGAGCGSVTAA